MKTDINRLMQQRGVDGILVTGSAQDNPYMAYFTGVSHITEADLIQPAGRPPVLFAHSMEREEAARTGLETRNLEAYSLTALLAEAGGDPGRAIALRYQKMLTDLSLTSGRLALFGMMDAGISYTVFTQLQKLMPDLELVGETGNSLLMEAMATKDADELDQIRRMGQATVEVVGAVADFLTSHPVKDEVLVKKDGSPLTVRDVKRRIDLWLAERGAENPEGAIFAPGRDGGIPHSAGSPEAPLRLGQTIVFDIFPRQAGGGYFYDFTRTWCLGYAPDEALALYEDVRAVFDHLLDTLRIGALCKDYQNLACDLFEAKGYPTIREDPAIQDGYVHGLGHGIGLFVHERPSFSLFSSLEDTLQAGMVFTLEPGLYYPERGLGVRLEDSLVVHQDGSFEILAPFPYDLVLPMPNSR
jgi:Xaa-Pro aminopeptidase